MKIINYNDFVKYSAGTIFSYYEPAIFVGLWRKEDTIYCDGQATDYFQQSLLPYHENEEKIVIGGIERWGEYIRHQLYAIYEKEDIERLRQLLKL